MVVAVDVAMEIADFKALCKPPARRAYVWNGQPGLVSTHHGMNANNIRRIMEDQFPAGTPFQFLGATCWSRGPTEPDQHRFGQPKLQVIAPARTGGLEIVYFGVKEVLSMARQISVDAINRMNEAVEAA